MYLKQYLNFGRLSTFCGFHSGMFRVFAILTKYLLKIFTILCFLDIERFFAVNIIFQSYKPFSVKKDLQSFQKILFLILFLVEINFLGSFFQICQISLFFKCYYILLFPLLFALILSLDLVMISFLIHNVHWHINSPFKYTTPFFLPSPSPLNWQTVRVPLFQAIPPSILIFHEPPPHTPKSRIFQ